MRECVNARTAREFELAGQPARDVQAKIDALTEQFAGAKAANDEALMTAIAASRRQEWAALAQTLKSVRVEHKAELKSFLAPIGMKSTCETYKLRSKYVADGLGWATANSVLDDALKAFQSTIKKGQAPRFAIGAEIDRDTLSLQFTTAGGIPAEKLLSGAHNECQLRPPAAGFAPRKYGELRFRLGAAKADQWATGTWQAHRPLPEGAHVAGVSLVRDRVGPKFTYNIQLLLKLPERIKKAVPSNRSELGVLHVGWSADSNGRRIGGWTTDADAGLATILNLPQEVETGLNQAAEIESTRSKNRDDVFKWFKELPVAAVSTWTAPEVAFLVEEFSAIRRLPATYVSPSRLHRFWWNMQRNNLVTDDWLELTNWRSVDKLNHQNSIHGSKRARNLRKNHYRNLALSMCQQCKSIVIDSPDLSEAAIVVNKNTGERNELNKKARAGRVVVALYELISAIKWAAARCDTVLIETDGDTASVCSSCGGIGLRTVEDTQYQQQECPHCGAVHDRKLNAAASTFQRIANGVDALRAEHMLAVDSAAEARKAKMAGKLQAIQDARRANILSRNSAKHE